MWYRLSSAVTTYKYIRSPTNTETSRLKSLKNLIFFLEKTFRVTGEKVGKIGKETPNLISEGPRLQITLKSPNLSFIPRFFDLTNGC